VVLGAAFLAGTWAGVLGLSGTLAVLFCFLCCIGVTNPNASALAIAPFTRNAGSASALLGFFQLGTRAVISTLDALCRVDATQQAFCQSVGCTHPTRGIGREKRVRPRVACRYP
jgi:hypothetical protein